MDRDQVCSIGIGFEAEVNIFGTDRDQVCSIRIGFEAEVNIFGTDRDQVHSIRIRFEAEVNILGVNREVDPQCWNRNWGWSQYSQCRQRTSPQHQNTIALRGTNGCTELSLCIELASPGQSTLVPSANGSLCSSLHRIRYQGATRWKRSSIPCPCLHLAV